MHLDGLITSETLTAQNTFFYTLETWRGEAHLLTSKPQYLPKYLVTKIIVLTHPAVCVSSDMVLKQQNTSHFQFFSCTGTGYTKVPRV